MDIHRADGTDADAENGAKAHHAIDEPPRHGQQLFRGALADILRFKGEDVQIEIAQHHGNARFADEQADDLGRVRGKFQHDGVVARGGGGAFKDVAFGEEIGGDLGDGHLVQTAQMRHLRAGGPPSGGDVSEQKTAVLAF